jgi:cation transport regulator ChaC
MALPPTFLYFAYGSNMLSRRLRERTPSAAARAVGCVDGRRLTFDKASRDASGKCDIEPFAGERVWGVVFEIARSEKAALDEAEGLGRGYREERLPVLTPAGAVEAVTYVATAKDPALRPYDWYKAFVVAGALEHALPEPYVERLRKVASRPDPDAARSRKNEELLHGRP